MDRVVSSSAGPRSLVASSTLAGCGRAGHRDGSRAEAMFSAPHSGCQLPHGLLLVADGKAIRIVEAAQEDRVYTLSTLPFLSACSPVVIDEGAGVVIADAALHKVRLLQLEYLGQAGAPGPTRGSPRVRVVSDLVLAGSGKPGHADGDASTAQLHRPSGLCVIADGSILVSCSGSHSIQRISGRPGTTGLFVSTVVGCATPGHADGDVHVARLHAPGSLAFDPASGCVAVADVGNAAIRVLHPPPMELLLGGAPATELPPGSWALTTLRSSPSSFSLLEPTGLLVHGDALLVSDGAANTVSALCADGDDDGPADDAPALQPLHVLPSSDGTHQVLLLRHRQFGSVADGDTLLQKGGRVPSLVVPPSLLEPLLSQAAPAPSSNGPETFVRALRDLVLRGAARAEADAAVRGPAPAFRACESPSSSSSSWVTPAVMMLQATLRAAIVPYHDPAQVQAVHARWRRCVHVSGQRPGAAAGGAAALATAVRKRSGAAAHSSSSPFVLARSTSAAEASRSPVRFYADGAVYEARFKRPAGMFPASLGGDAASSGVVVCDARNAMLRVLWPADAVVRQPVSDAVARLVPAWVLQQAASVWADRARRKHDGSTLASTAVRRDLCSAPAAPQVSSVGSSRPLARGSSSLAAAPRAAVSRHNRSPSRDATHRAVPRTAPRPSASVGIRASGAAFALQRAPAASAHVRAHYSLPSAAASSLLLAAAQAFQASPVDAAGNESSPHLAHGLSFVSAIPRSQGDDEVVTETGFDADGSADLVDSHPDVTASSETAAVTATAAVMTSSTLDLLAAMTLDDLVQDDGVQSLKAVDDKLGDRSWGWKFGRSHAPVPPLPSLSQLDQRMSVTVSAPASSTTEAPAAVSTPPAIEPNRLSGLLHDLRDDLTPELECELREALLGSLGGIPGREEELAGAGGGEVASLTDPRPTLLVDHQTERASVGPAHRGIASGARLDRWARRGHPTTPMLTSSIAGRAAHALPSGAGPGRPGSAARPGQGSPSTPGHSPADVDGHTSGRSSSHVNSPEGLSLAASSLSTGREASGAAGALPVFAARSVPRLTRAGALSASFLSEQLCPSRNSVGAADSSTAVSSRDALAREETSDTALLVRHLVTQQAVHRQLLTSRFAQHTAASSQRLKAAGRPVVRTAPAFINVSALLEDSNRSAALL